MTLQEAIEEVKRDSGGAEYLTERGILYVVKTHAMRTATATILNAVVKG